MTNENSGESSNGNPLVARPFYVRALSLHVTVEGVDKAIENYGIAISNDSNCVMAYFGRGLAYEQMGQNNNAMQDFEKVTDTFGMTIAKAYCLRSKHYFRLSADYGVEGNSRYLAAYKIAMDKARELGYPCP